MIDTLYDIADQLRATANAGLQYAQNDYDKARYERILKLSARLLSLVEPEDEKTLFQTYLDNLHHLCPQLGSSALIYKDQKILLGRRSDNGLWDKFGGLVDVGETLAEAAIREAKEEINVDIRLIRPLGIFDSRLWHTRTKAHMYHAMFLAEIVAGEPSISHEVTELGWFKEDALPELHYSLVETMPMLLKQLKNDKAAPYFDGLT